MSLPVSPAQIIVACSLRTQTRRTTFSLLPLVLCKTFVDSELHSSCHCPCQAHISITTPSPLPLARLSSSSAAVGATFGVSSMPDTIETKSFEAFNGIVRNLLGERLDVDSRTTAVLAVGAWRDVLIPVALDFR